MYNYITQINLNHKVLYTIKWCIGNIGLRKYFFAAITSIHLLITNYKSLKYKYKIVNHRDYTQIKIAIILCDLENYRHFLN